jgi:hypothetical protein
MLAARKLVGGMGDCRRNSGGPIEEPDRFFEFQCISGLVIKCVCGAHIFTRQPTPSTPASADSKDMFDWQQSGAAWRLHENLLGLELANDHSAAIVYSFFQVFQQRIPMRCVVPYDIVF